MDSSSIMVSDEEDSYEVLYKEVASSNESLIDISTDLLNDCEYSSNIGHTDNSQHTSMYQSINDYDCDSLFAELEKLKRENCELLEINKILETKNNIKNEEIEKLKMLNKANVDVKISFCETQIFDNEEKLFQTENLDDAILQESTSTHNTEPQEMFKNLKEEFTLSIPSFIASNSIENSPFNENVIRFKENYNIYSCTMTDIADFINYYNQSISTFNTNKQFSIVNTNKEFKDCVISLKTVLETNFKKAVEYNHRIKSSIETMNKIIIDYHSILQYANQKNDEIIDLNNKYINQTIQLGEITTKVIKLEDSERKLIKEICELEENIKGLQKPSEEVEILKTQLEIYKSDLIVEKQSRELLESSKCDMETQFNTLNIHHKELLREFVRLENMVSGKENSTISLKYLQRYNPSYIFFCPLCQYSAGSIKLLEDHIKLH